MSSYDERTASFRHALMLQCWAEKPEDRPTFSICKGRIARILEASSSEAYKSLLLVLFEAWRNLPTIMAPAENGERTAAEQEDSGPVSEGRDVETDGLHSIDETICLEVTTYLNEAYINVSRETSQYASPLADSTVCSMDHSSEVMDTRL